MPPSTTTLAPVTKPERSPSSSQGGDFGDVFRLADAAGGCWAWSLRRALIIFGRDPAGADAIDPHIRAEADRERVGQRHQPALRGGIGFGVGLRHQRAGRGDRDDRAVRLAQRLLGGAGQQERGGQIGVDDAVPFFQRQLAQRLADHDAGIGDDGVKPAEVLDQRCDGARRRFFLAHVAFDTSGIALAWRESALKAATGQIDDADAPAAASRWRAMARPMPFAPPVTRRRVCRSPCQCAR